MVKLYGSTQHSAVHLLLASFSDGLPYSPYIALRVIVPSQINDVRMRAPSVRMSNIVQRDIVSQSHRDFRA